MIKNLSVEQKNALYIFIQLVGELEKGVLNVPFSPKARETILKCYKELFAMFEEFVQELDPKICKQVVKDIKNMTIQCVSKDEAKKAKKNSHVYVKQEAIDCLAEQAMEFCVDCKRNKRACKLRNVFRDLNIPEYDPEELQGCKYKMIKELRI